MSGSKVKGETKKELKKPKISEYFDGLYHGRTSSGTICRSSIVSVANLSSKKTTWLSNSYLEDRMKEIEPALRCLRLETGDKLLFVGKTKTFDSVVKVQILAEICAQATAVLLKSSVFFDPALGGYVVVANKPYATDR